MPSKYKYINYICAFFSLLALWYVVSALVALPIVPTPLAVFYKVYRIFLPVLAIHMGFSLLRIFSGILLSCIIGIPLGLLTGYYKSWDKLLSPAVYFIYPIPKIALLPIVMLLFGLGDTSKVIMITMIILFQVMVASRDAVKDIPSETFHSLYSLGAGKLLLFRELIMPATVPALLTSIRISLGTALSVLFFTETFGTEHGMGFFIMDSWLRVNYPEMYAGILVLSIMGFCLFLLVDGLEKVLCRWKG